MAYEPKPDMKSSEEMLTIIGDGIANQSKNESLKMLKIRFLASQNKRDEAIEMYKESGVNVIYYEDEKGHKYSK